MPKRTINTRAKKIAAADATPVQPTPVKRALDASDPIATPDASDDTPVAIDATISDIAAAAPVAVPSKPDLKAEFIERKAAAILSALPLYDGQSLSVHRSDKIPAGQAYLERVAAPVQKAKSATSRDDSALLTYYDHLATYFGGDYTSGFNPDRFGADLGALSRNASLNRVALTDDKQHVRLTALGISQARNLVSKRDKA
jgi:hypothetical protein